jgi:uncharacterized protein involved in exopolysaccharide biosynthesis
MPVAPAPVLDYAPPSPRPVRDFLARLRDPAIVVAAALLAGVVAWFAQPPRYIATAYVQLVVAWHPGINPADWKAALDKHAQGLSQDTPSDANAAWTPHEYQRRLRVKPLMDSSLIAVSFTDTNSKRAADTVNALLDRYVGSGTQPKQRDLQIDVVATPWIEPQRSWVVAGIGFGVGFIAAVMVLRLIRRGRPLPANPPAQ